MICDKSWLRLYAVTDRAWVGRESLEEQVEHALLGGATCIQLREKELPEELFLSEAKRIHALCADRRVPMIVNDNVEVALRCGAEGVHIGQHDENARAVRRRIGGGMLMGVSASTLEEALGAVSDGADYLGVGAIFTTSTKPDADTVSLEELSRICRAVPIPVVAIGGIHRGNLLKLTGTGAAGAAIVSAIFSAPDIEAECRELRALAEEMSAK